MARRWEASEDAQLAQLYARGLPLRMIAEALGRTEDALTARRKLLGIAPRRPPVSWAEHQDRLIVLAARAGVSAATLARQQGRSTQQVRARRAQLLGKRPPARPYRASEDEAIIAGWSGWPDLDELALRLGRTPDALRLRARALGLHAAVRRRRWSSGEDHALREGYSLGLSCAEIHRHELPHRTPEAIAARARKLGLTSYARLWSIEDERRLALLIAHRAPLEQIAVLLTRTPEAIRQRARKLRLPTPDHRDYPQNTRRWSRAEDDVLRAARGAHPSMLTNLLGRSDHAIRQRQRRLGLRSGTRSPHNAPVGGPGFLPAEDRLLRRELADGQPPKATRVLALSARLGRPPGELRRRREEIQPLPAALGDQREP
jgi:hypothetical protein